MSVVSSHAMFRRQVVNACLWMVPYLILFLLWRGEWKSGWTFFAGILSLPFAFLVASGFWAYGILRPCLAATLPKTSEPEEGEPRRRVLQPAIIGLGPAGISTSLFILLLVGSGFRLAIPVGAMFLASTLLVTGVDASYHARYGEKLEHVGSHALWMGFYTFYVLIVPLATVVICLLDRSFGASYDYPLVPGFYALLVLHLAFKATHIFMRWRDGF